MMRALFVLGLVVMLAGCTGRRACCTVVADASETTAPSESTASESTATETTATETTATERGPDGAEASEAKPPPAEALRPSSPDREPPDRVETIETRPGVHQVLAKKRVKGLKWKDTSLDQAAMYLQTISGVKFQLSVGVRKGHLDKVRLNADLDDVDLATVVRVVMTEPWGLAYEVRNGVVHIITRSEKRQALRLRYFDVKDLVMTKGTSRDGFTKPGEKPLAPPKPAPVVNEVRAAELDVGIRKAVHPEAWLRDDVTMEQRNGILIVRAPREVLDGVSAYLDRMRRLAREAK